MLITLEGADGAGKTTLGNQLEAVYRERPLAGRVTRLHTGPPDPPDRNIYAEYEPPLVCAVDEHDPRDLIIQDRWMMGDMVYGPLLRGSTRLSPGGLLHGEMLAEALGAVRLMMMPPLAILRKRLHERGDNLIDGTDLAYLHKTYQYLAPRYGYKQLRDAPDEEGLKSLLRLAGEKAIAATAVAAVAPGYIGVSRPVAVLAGDIRSGSENETEDDDPLFRHAFTPAAPGSASYLMDVLAIASRTVIKSMGILNTGERGMDLKLADEMLGHPRWVALGSNATKRLHSAGFWTAQQLPHPQYWRRFRYDEAGEYATRIMQTAGVSPL